MRDCIISDVINAFQQHRTSRVRGSGHRLLHLCTCVPIVRDFYSVLICVPLCLPQASGGISLAKSYLLVCIFSHCCRRGLNQQLPDWVEARTCFQPASAQHCEQCADSVKLVDTQLTSFVRRFYTILLGKQWLLHRRTRRRIHLVDCQSSSSGKNAEKIRFDGDLQAGLRWLIQLQPCL